MVWCRTSHYLKTRQKTTFVIILRQNDLISAVPSKLLRQFMKFISLFFYKSCIVRIFLDSLRNCTGNFRCIKYIKVLTPKVLRLHNTIFVSFVAACPYGKMNSTTHIHRVLQELLRKYYMVLSATALYVVGGKAPPKLQYVFPNFEQAS